MPAGIPASDLSHNEGPVLAPAKGLNGTYSTRLFTDQATGIIASHAHSDAGPLYLYVAPQNVHLACGSKDSKLVQGIQAPCETADLYPLVVNDTFKGQSAVTTELDYLVGNITAAVKAAGMWNNTLIVFTSDNGGPLDHTTNYPLRGGKHTFWDGGVRVVAALGGGILPEGRRGKTFPGLAHSADWYATLAEGVAGGRIAKHTGPLPPDSQNLWPALLQGTDSPRTEIIHQVSNKHFSEHVTAIRVGSLKLILGPPGDSRTLKWPELAPRATEFGSSGGIRREGSQCLAGINTAEKGKSTQCKRGCLYDIVKDPEESENLVDDPEYKEMVAEMKGKLQKAGSLAPPQNSYYGERGQDPTGPMDAICAAEALTGFLEPFDF